MKVRSGEAGEKYLSVPAEARPPGTALWLHSYCNDGMNGAELVPK